MYVLAVLMCLPVSTYAGNKVSCADSDWLKIGGYQTFDSCKWAADAVSARHKVLARCVVNKDEYGGWETKLEQQMCAELRAAGRECNVKD